MKSQLLEPEELAAAVAGPEELVAAVEGAGSVIDEDNTSDQRNREIICHICNSLTILAITTKSS